MKTNLATIWGMIMFRVFNRIRMYRWEVKQMTLREQILAAVEDQMILKFPTWRISTRHLESWPWRPIPNLKLILSPEWNKVLILAFQVISRLTIWKIKTTSKMANSWVLHKSTRTKCMHSKIVINSITESKSLKTGITSSIWMMM